jgi:hypothetical protein
LLLVLFHAKSDQKLEKEIKELHKKRELAIKAFKDIGKQYEQLAKDREFMVYHTQPNVDSAISQDTSLIVLTLMYMNVRNVSVVWPF